MQLAQFDSVAAWAGAVAKLWCDRLRQQPNLRLCLASGNTPIPVYAAMVEAVKRREVSFRDAEIFALDEYGGLTEDDPGRCVNMLRRHLGAGVDLPPERFHWLDTAADDIERVCRDYDARIGAGFDLAILGIGRNGHLGLNEPGEPLDLTTHRVAMHAASTEASRAYVQGNRLPTWGITVGFSQLFAAREVWMLASGPAKAGIVRSIACGEPDSTVPAVEMRRHPNGTLFVDAAAGALLAGPSCCSAWRRSSAALPSKIPAN
jgi:glucosamine-6-phosphate deaminase